MYSEYTVIGVIKHTTHRRSADRIHCPLEGLCVFEGDLSLWCQRHCRREEGQGRTDWPGRGRAEGTCQAARSRIAGGHCRAEAAQAGREEEEVQLRRVA